MTTNRKEWERLHLLKELVYMTIPEVMALTTKEFMDWGNGNKRVKII
jgi:hypothetical protein